MWDSERGSFPFSFFPMQQQNRTEHQRGIVHRFIECVWLMSLTSSTDWTQEVFSGGHCNQHGTSQGRPVIRGGTLRHPGREEGLSHHHAHMHVLLPALLHVKPRVGISMVCFASCSCTLASCTFPCDRANLLHVHEGDAISHALDCMPFHACVKVAPSVAPTALP